MHPIGYTINMKNELENICGNAITAINEASKATSNLSESIIIIGAALVSIGDSIRRIEAENARKKKKKRKQILDRLMFWKIGKVKLTIRNDGYIL